MWKQSKKDSWFFNIFTKQSKSDQKNSIIQSDKKFEFDILTTIRQLPAVVMHKWVAYDLQLLQQTDWNVFCCYLSSDFEILWWQPTVAENIHLWICELALVLLDYWIFGEWIIKQSL